MWRWFRDGVRVVDVLGELFGSLDTCYHLDAGQILTSAEGNLLLEFRYIDSLAFRLN